MRKKNFSPDFNYRITLELFAVNHVFWYGTGIITDKAMIKSFRFKQLSTP